MFPVNIEKHWDDGKGDRKVKWQGEREAFGRWQTWEQEPERLGMRMEAVVSGKERNQE